MMTFTWNQPACRPSWDNVLDALNNVLAMALRKDSNSREIEVSGHDIDRQNITAILKGDGEAFGRLVTKYQPAIATQMRRFSREPSVLEELVHDVFVEAFISLKSYRSRAPLLHWLRTIAVRVGYQYWKRQSRERESTVPLSKLNDEFGKLASGLLTDGSEASEVIGDLLERLSPRNRLVLTLIYWDGCTTAEAAKLAGWSQTMVKVQAHRARKRLKKLIEESRS